MYRDTHSLQLESEVILLLDQGDLLLLQLLTLGLRLLQCLLQLEELLLEGGQLLLRGGTLQQRLDLEEELHPRPVLHYVKGPDVPLNDHQSLP